jgi:hypothetical protein
MSYETDKNANGSDKRNAETIDGATLGAVSVP